MVNVAIICEYNPFHKGHAAQIRYIKERFYPEEARVICIMSGNYVQRGDLALMQKYKRAEIAVRCGASLVLELPFPFSVFSAEGFARSGMSIVSRLKGIDYLCFGSECGDTERIQRCAANLQSAEFRERLAELNKSEFGMPYAALREKLYLEMFGEPLLRSPNDILALEYVKALMEEGSNIKILSLERDFRYSATRAREALFNADRDTLVSLVPDITYDALAECKPMSISGIQDYLLTYFSLAEAEHISELCELNFDLARKMISAAKRCTDLESFISAVSDKRYTRARVRRALLFAMFNVKKSCEVNKPLYTNILALDSDGREYLSGITDSNIHVISRRRELYSDKKALSQYDISLKADLFYERQLMTNDIKVIKNLFSKN